MHTQVRPGVRFGNDRECRLFGRTYIRGLKQKIFYCNRTIGRAYIFAAMTLGVLLSATTFASAAEEVNIIDGATLNGYDVVA